MPNAPHILEVVFEGAILGTGLFYLASWMGGSKLTNVQILFLFAIGFAVLLVLSLFSSIVPTFLLAIACSTPLWRLLKRIHIQQCKKS